MEALRSLFVLLPKRVRVFITNLLPYLILAQTVLATAIGEGALDAWPEWARYATMALTGIGAAVLFIRGVTPVPKEERGLLNGQTEGGDNRV